MHSSSKIKWVMNGDDLAFDSCFVKYIVEAPPLSPSCYDQKPWL